MHEYNNKLDGITCKGFIWKKLLFQNYLRMTSSPSLFVYSEFGLSEYYDILYEEIIQWHEKF